MIKTNPLKVFYSYSHDDIEYRKALGDHLSLLRHTHIIEDWHDGCLVPGEEWEPQIEKFLKQQI